MWVAWISGILGTLGSQIGFKLNTAAGAFMGAFFVSFNFFHYLLNTSINNFFLTYERYVYLPIYMQDFLREV